MSRTCSVQFNLCFFEIQLSSQACDTPRASVGNSGPQLSGGIAQLVERLLCKQDVIGSNPVTSTKFIQVFWFATQIFDQLRLSWMMNGNLQI